MSARSGERLERRDDAGDGYASQQDRHRDIQPASFALFADETVIVNEIERLPILILEIIRLCVVASAAASSSVFVLRVSRALSPPIDLTHPTP